MKQKETYPPKWIQILQEELRIIRTEKQARNDPTIEVSEKTAKSASYELHLVGRKQR
jgi:hypothetical protein